MADVFSKEKRSEVMSHIRSRGNKSTELALIHIFNSEGITGWFTNSTLPGKPDFVFPESKIAVFVDGCFWHGHLCRKRRPAQNSGYWKDKIEHNQKRDGKITRELRKAGWSVHRIWECEIEKRKYNRKIKLLRRKIHLKLEEIQNASK